MSCDSDHWQQRWKDPNSSSRQIYEYNKFGWIRNCKFFLNGWTGTAWNNYLVNYLWSLNNIYFPFEWPLVCARTEFYNRKGHNRWLLLHSNLSKWRSNETMTKPGFQRNLSLRLSDAQFYGLLPVANAINALQACIYKPVKKAYF